ncbi:MAG: hypothetical protein Q7S84_04205 [bacterium]|nr:hypothetical protein [bacterium]
MNPQPNANALAVAFRIVGGAGLSPADQGVLKDRLADASEETLGRFIKVYQHDASGPPARPTESSGRADRAGMNTLVESLKAKRAVQNDLDGLRKVLARERERVRSLCGN